VNYTERQPLVGKVSVNFFSPPPLPSISFPIHYSFVILSLSALSSCSFLEQNAKQRNVCDFVFCLHLAGSLGSNRFSATRKHQKFDYFIPNSQLLFPHLSQMKALYTVISCFLPYISHHRHFNIMAYRMVAR
jgi:hypothetical protein